MLIIILVSWFKKLVDIDSTHTHVDITAIGRFSYFMVMTELVLAAHDECLDETVESECKKYKEVFWDTPEYEIGE